MLPWDAAAQQVMEELLEQQPVLVRISAAKRMRDQAERDARERGDTQVQAQRFIELFGQTNAAAHA